MFYKANIAPNNGLNDLQLNKGFINIDKATSYNYKFFKYALRSGTIYHSVLKTQTFMTQADGGRAKLQPLMLNTMSGNSFVLLQLTIACKTNKCNVTYQ